MYTHSSPVLILSALLHTPEALAMARVPDSALPPPPDSGTCSSLTGTESIDTSRHSAERCLTGDDPFSDQQWHLLNTGQAAFALEGGVAGNDLNLWWAHRQGIYGQSVNVAVVDDGLEIDHPDLVGNVLKGKSYDFVDGDEDPTPKGIGNRNTSHGTSVAGIIAAERNNGLGGQGVAPHANLQGYNYLQSQSQTTWEISHGRLGYSDEVRVFNQSYGHSGVRSYAYNDDPLSYSGRQMAQYQHMSTKAHGELGAVFVKSAGNGYHRISFNRQRLIPVGDNAGLPWQNSNQSSDNANYWNVTVSAMNADGLRSSYSSVGSNVFLTAPGGEYGSDKPAHITTDLTGCDMGYNRTDKVPYGRHALHGSTVLDNTCDYNSVMNGTSSAAPNASGAFALLMSAYPTLTQRDIRHLFATTATRVDAEDKDIRFNYRTSQGKLLTITGLEGWQQNAAGRWFNPDYGFGLIDVNAALKAARNHPPLPAQVITDWQWRYHNQEHDTPLDIVDAGPFATTDTVSINDDLTIEAIQVRVSIEHSRQSDLLIELESPSGTRSVLMSPKNSMLSNSLDPSYPKGFTDHLMLSHKFYGEQAAGHWTLRVTDTNGDIVLYTLGEVEQQIANNVDPGQLTQWSLRVIGHRS
ncbi:S8 family serine peptidase [Vibrio coralliilyticus]|uniref:S8 family serine peptidase n=1 Tax=Vibrio coralliilyticus TaxID=190893 RepID=UPI0017CA198E|nr:S8 family peptidase [Vibrio coralliilyticus]NUW67107.1 S8 family serine peptidase [Vibrio coralliilyticus]